MDNKSHLLNYSEKWMSRALRIAQKGWGASIPNPCVGAVLVKGDKEVAFAHSQAKGGPHAEATLINDMLNQGRDVSDCDLFVTLEPCSHHGKNPPCTEAILRAGIKKVYVGSLDKNPKVSGLELLKSKGIQCEVEDLGGEVEFFYRGFNHFIKNDTPLVVLKLAIDPNGVMAKYTDKLQNQKSPVKVTGSETKNWVHNLRSWFHGIGVSRETLQIDNPQLNNRYNPDEWGSGPRPFILSRNEREDSNKPEDFIELLKLKELSWFTNSNKNDFEGYFKDCLKALYKKGYHQVLIEAGPELGQKIINSRLFNELILLRSKSEVELAPNELPLGIDLNWLNNCVKSLKASPKNLTNLKFPSEDVLEWYLRGDN